MKIIAVFLSALNLAFAVSNAVKIEVKNVTTIEESNIIGGVVADISYAPSQVAILFRNRFFCSGSIIKEDVILSVAHCLVYKNIPLLKIRSGSTFHDKDGRVVAVLKAKIHHLYVHCDDCYNFDIGLLFLANPATALGIPASVIYLWDTGTVFAPGTFATLFGWGATRQNANGPSPILRRLDVPVIPGYVCDAHGAFLGTYNICAGYLNGKRDACKGDSGAGLMIGNRLAGVHAFGKCGKPRYPSGYTSVPIFRMWIRKQANV